MLEVGAAQARAYRMAAQGLGREASRAEELDVLALGIQHNASLVAQALAARVRDASGLAPGAAADPLRDNAFVVMWSYRGAPHLLRRADVPGLARALWPVSEADAMARMVAERVPLRAAGIGGLEAFAAMADAEQAVVDRPRGKGEVSHAVTERLPEAYSYACRVCKATHVYGGLFQLAGLFAGVRLVPEATQTTLAPLENRAPALGADARAEGPGGPIRAYLRLHGPATHAAAGRFLGTTGTIARAWWPEDAVEVRLEGRRAWILEESLDAVAEPPAAPDVRLVPAYDPFLQSRDRETLVSDAVQRKAVWRILGNPGALIVRGSVAGTWRGKLLGSGNGRRLEVTVEPFGRLTKGVRAAIESEAARLAAVRGAPTATVRSAT